MNPVQNEDLLINFRLLIWMQKSTRLPGLKWARCSSMTSQSRLQLLMMQRLLRGTILRRLASSKCSASTARRALLLTGLQLPEVLVRQSSNLCVCLRYIITWPQSCTDQSQISHADSQAHRSGHGCVCFPPTPAIFVKYSKQADDV